MTLAIIFTYAGGLGFAQTLDLQKDFRAANKLYHDGKFADASKAYQKIVAGGCASACLFYNLGDAYVKTGELGKAVLSYERALREDPRDPEAKANLDYVRGLLSDRSEEGGIMDLVQKFSPSQWISWRENTWGFVLLYWIGIVVAMVGIFMRRGRKGVFTGASVFLGLALVLATTLFLRSSLWADPQAIVMAKEAEVRYGPVLGESTAFTLHEGSKVRVLRSAGDWVQILFAKGKVGWLPSEMLERI